MKKYSFTSTRSYTSHKGLSAEEERSMQRSTSDVPNYFWLEGQWVSADFLSQLHDESETRTQAGYAKVKGIKIRIRRTHCHPDFDKENGCGSATWQWDILSEGELEFKQ